MKINTYKNVKSPTINGETDINEWFDLIKGKDIKLTKKILEARSYPKDKNPNSPYNKIKSSLPCVTYNFTFNNRKKNDNVKGPTGLLYIDIDDLIFNIDDIDPKGIYASYRSYGGLGYSLLVQVEGLTLNNYKPTFQAVTKELGIEELADKGAVKATQFNVLSYDEDLVINTNSTVFKAVDTAPLTLDFSKKVEPSKMGHSQHKKEEEKSIYVGNDPKRKIRFDNLDEVVIPEGKDYVYFSEGIEWVNCSCPWGKPISERRGAFLLAYCNNLVWLNPWMTKETLQPLMEKINQKVLMPAVNSKRLDGILDSILSYRDQGTLKAHINPKKRKYVYREKRTRLDLNRIMNERKMQECKEKIYDSLESWDFESNGKISIRKVAKESGVGETTVKKHWHIFKEFATELNETFKNK